MVFSQKADQRHWIICQLDKMQNGKDLLFEKCQRKRNVNSQLLRLIFHHLANFIS